jgi:hypothetical protein
MNKYDTQLCDLIHVEKGVIPSDLCDSLVEEIKDNEWTPHIWNSGSSSWSEDTMELDVQYPTSEYQELLTPFIFQAGDVYNMRYSFNCERTNRIMYNVSPIRFNRYSSGQIMRQHHDHIHSLFDGNKKGIPVLSFVINFNDDYEGAELFFWDDYVVPLGKGDIIMFPSLFLFPHGVREATKGKRYSAVCWAW